MAETEITFHPFTHVTMHWQYKDGKRVMFFFADTEIDGKEVKVGTWLFPDDAAAWVKYLSKDGIDKRPLGFTVKR